MAEGYMGKIGFVNLSTGDIREEKLDEKMARDFIGGYGLGVRILFEHQKKNIDPLGPENTIGFTTGPLTGTKTPTGARYMAVCKSPLTGGWGDANSGGYFGSALKSAGWDALFVKGQASEPRYLLVTEDLTWTELMGVAALDQGPFGDHLRRQQWLLRDELELRLALKQVIEQQQCDDEMALFRLLQSGLIKGSGDFYTCRCDLYRRYFKDKLL